MSIQFRLLASGSSGNVGLLSAPGEDGQPYEVLVDAGLPWRHCLRRAPGIKPRALVLTHDHSDHVRYAAEYARLLGIPVYATAGTAARSDLEGAEHRALRADKIVHLGPFELRPFATPHDAEEPVGLVFRAGGASLGWVTDLGEAPSSVEEALAGCDAAVLEFNHDPDLLRRGSYPWYLKRRILGARGHLSNEQGGDLLRRLSARGKLRLAVLAHLSESNNSPELAKRAALSAIQGRPVSVELAEAKRSTAPFRVFGPATQLSLF